MVASLFIWLCVMNEIASGNFDTTLNGFSYIISLFALVLLVLQMLFPILMVYIERRRKVDEEDQVMEKTDEEKTILAKIIANYQFGFKKTILAQLFFTALQFKYFCCSIIFILIEDKNVQISLFIIMISAYCIYYVIARPFNYLIENIALIFNEFFLLFISFMFLGFLEDGDQNEGLATTIIVLFTIDIIISFIVGFGFQIYLLTRRGQNPKLRDDAPQIDMKKNQSKENSLEKSKMNNGLVKDDKHHIKDENYASLEGKSLRADQKNLESFEVPSDNYETIREPMKVSNPIDPTIGFLPEIHDQKKTLNVDGVIEEDRNDDFESKFIIFLSF